MSFKNSLTKFHGASCLQENISWSHIGINLEQINRFSDNSLRSSMYV